MAREEAIELLQFMVDEGFWFEDEKGERNFFPCGEEQVVLNMAIEALKEVDELQRKIDIDHAEYTNLWAENQRLKQERPKGRCEYCKDGKTFAGQSIIFCADNKFHKINFCPNCGASMVGADMREREQE